MRYPQKGKIRINRNYAFGNASWLGFPSAVSLCLEAYQQIIDLRLTQDVDKPGRHWRDFRGQGFFDIVSRYNHCLLGGRITSCPDVTSFDMHRLPNDHCSIREYVSGVAILGVNDFRGD
jgi:hypothetical protein